MGRTWVAPGPQHASHCGRKGRFPADCCNCVRKLVECDLLTRFAKLCPQVGGVRFVDTLCKFEQWTTTMDNVHELMLQAVFDVQNGQVCRDLKQMNISYVHHHRCCPSHLNQTHQQSPASSRLQSPYGPMVAPPLGGASHLRPCIDGVLRGILAIAADAGSRRSSRSWSG